MKIIPVLDILEGQGVHAVKGRRNDYQPLKSVLAGSSAPLDIAAAFRRLEFKELYIADLDAIMGKGENLAIIKKIAAETGLELWVDSGTFNMESARKLLGSGVSNLIVGTETLTELALMTDLLKAFGSEKVVVSLDLKNGKVLSKSPAISESDPLDLAAKIQEIGVENIIVLDLARVGSCEGGDFPLVKRLVDNLVVNVFVGGGVRDIQDLLTLRDLNVKGALLATSLHNGNIRIEELKKIGEI